MFHKRFPPAQAREWFEQRGVVLKTEADGRMFPNTDSSQTIINALLGAADEAGVHVEKQLKVTAIEKDEETGGFVVLTQGKDKDSSTKVVGYDAVILATGSSPSGYKLASELGLKMVKPVPSLFTLSSKDQVKEGGLLYNLSGLSVPNARITFKVPGMFTKSSHTLSFDLTSVSSLCDSHSLPIMISCGQEENQNATTGRSATHYSSWHFWTSYVTVICFWSTRIS